MVYPQVNDPISIPQGTPDKTLFVSVDGTWQENGCLASLEDCARGHWTEQNLSASHGYDCEWLMARKRGRIVGVWKIDRDRGWLIPSATPKVTCPSDKPKNPPARRGCVLISVDEETAGRFLGKEVHLGRNKNTLRGYFV